MICHCVDTTSIILSSVTIICHISQQDVVLYVHMLDYLYLSHSTFVQQDPRHNTMVCTAHNHYCSTFMLVAMVRTAHNHYCSTFMLVTCHNRVTGHNTMVRTVQKHYCSTFMLVAMVRTAHNHYCSTFVVVTGHNHVTSQHDGP